ncbi:hypothetical protein N9N67_09210 [Bacteriovoracaceae bacterium]|nr:hypothetical protein [Bacteriovoracaceae bacterium]
MKKQLILGVVGVVICIGLLIYFFEIRGKGLVGINCNESEKLRVSMFKKLDENSKEESTPRNPIISVNKQKFQFLGLLLTEQEIANISYNPNAQIKEESKESFEASIKNLKFNNLLKEKAAVIIKVKENLVSQVQNIIRTNVGNYLFYHVGKKLEVMSPVINELKSDSLAIVSQFSEETLSNFQKSFVCKEFLANSKQNKSK